MTLAPLALAMGLAAAPAEPPRSAVAPAARHADHVNILDFIPEALHSGIRAGTDTTDLHPYVMAAIDSATTKWQPQFPRSPAVYFPAGRYTLGSTLELKKVVRLFGDDSGMPYSSGPRLVWPAGVHGIVVHRTDTIGETSGPATTGADSTAIEGLQLWGTPTTSARWRKIAHGGETSLSGPDDSGVMLAFTRPFESVIVNSALRVRGADYRADASTTTISGLAPLAAGDVVEVVPFGGTAMWLRGRALIRNVFVRGWLGSGITVIAYATEQGAARGNANGFRIEGGRVEQCGRHGLYVDGNDANAGYVLGLDASLNAGWGIFDSSFLGNTYIATHAEGNALGPYKTDNANARNVLIGCYSESGQPGSSIVGPAVVLGGLHGAGFAQGGQLTGSGGGHLRGSAFSASDAAVTATLAGDARAQQAIYIKSADDEVPFRLRFREGNLQLVRGNGSGAVLEVTGTNTPHRHGRAAEQVGVLALPAGVVIGDASQGRTVTYRAEVPTSGAWARGDVVLNTHPLPGGKVGWVCTKGGTAGVDAVFKPFGAIDP
jgi:hypothetical protein